MMDPRDFLTLASELCISAREADRRTAVSRAYYAAFHVGRLFLAGSGFILPDAHQAHAYVWLRLSNGEHPDVREAGRVLNNLRSLRNRADYVLDRPLRETEPVNAVEDAMMIVRTLDDLATVSAVLARVVDAIRVYERDVLRDVTYRSP